MRGFVMPDYDPAQTKRLHEAIRAKKLKALHALIRKGVYVDATAFTLARQHTPEKVPALIEHQRKTFYG